MARLVFLLAALVALASAQAFIDDFLSPTASFDLETPNVVSDTRDRTVAVVPPNVIVGNEREIYIEGRDGAFTCTDNDNRPQSACTSGLWSIAQGTVCQADFELRLDGSQSAAQDSASRDFDLNLNLLTTGSGMTFRVFCDHPCDFEVEIASSASAVSRFSGQVTQAQSDNREVVFFSLDFNNDFTGSAQLNNIGAVSFIFPAEYEVDAEVSDWRFIQPQGAINGQIFEDCNCNGIQDTGDDSLANVVVSLNTGATTTTDINGQYSFGSLDAATYTVTVSGINHCDGNGAKSAVVNGNTVTVNFFAEVSSSSLTCPADTTTNCRATTTATTGSASVVATCSGSGGGSASFSDSVTPVACNTPGGQISTIARTFTASGLPSCTQQISVFDDETSPVLSIPSDFVTDDQDVCETGASTSVTGFATASGSCTPAVASFNDASSSSCQSDSCLFASTIIRTWSAVDECGNVAVSGNQRIECGGQTECPPCFSNVPTVSFPTVSFPTVSVPSVPISNPPTRNCRFICDDDDSSANILSVGVLAFVALFALLF